MKQLLQDYRTGLVRLEDVPAPAVRAGAVLVRNHFSLVSAGTERAAVTFARSNLIEKARKRPDLVQKVRAKASTEGPVTALKSALRRLNEWVPLGYASAGVVEEAGAGVTGFGPGSRVACAGGGYATHSEFAVVPRNLVAAVPDEVPLSDAAFTTLGAIALHGIHRSGARQGERVGVVGLGLIGLLTAQILRAYGHPVVGFDVSDAAAQRAHRFGIEDVVVTDAWSEAAARSVDAFTGGIGLDAVIVTAASPTPEPVNLAGEASRVGGTVCVVGDVGLGASRRLYYEKELNLTVSKSYGFGRGDESYERDGVDYPIQHARWTIQRNMSEFLRLLAEGRIRLEAFSPEAVAFADAPAAYERLIEGRAGSGTALLEYEAASGAGGPIDRTVLVTRDAPPARTGAVGVALVGAGAFAGATLLPALATVDGIRPVVVAARGGTRAAQAAKEYRFQRATTDLESVFVDRDVELVIVATRHDQHAALAVRALDAGKDVFVEKPLALTRDEVDAVRAAAARSGRRVHVGFNRRFAPFVRDAVEHFRGRATPLLMTCRVNAGALPPDHWLRDPRQGGGRIRGEVCHFVDLLQHLAASPVVRVFASGGGLDGVAADDHFTALVEFADGSRGTIVYSGAGPDALPKERLEIIGGGKAAIVDNFRTLTLIDGHRRRTRRAMSADKGHATQIEALVDTIRSGRGAPIPLDTLVNSTLATIALAESLDAGTPIRVEP